MTPSYRDIAEFTKLMVRFEFLDRAGIVRRADSILAELDQPPSWVIELALAGVEAALDRLDTVEGEIHGDLPAAMFCAYIRRLWLAGKIKMQEVWELGRKLGYEGTLPEPEEGTNWGAVLDIEYEGFHDGYRFLSEIRRSINEKIAPYAQYDDMLSVALKQLGCAGVDDGVSDRN